MSRAWWKCCPTYRCQSIRKTDLQDEENVKNIAQRLRDAKLEVVVEREEEHSAWMIGYKDPTNATRYINTEFLSTPEFRRLRAQVKQVARFNIAAVHRGQGLAPASSAKLA